MRTPHAVLVWDGQTLAVPEEMGEPRPDQLQGTDMDRLVELAGRVCYDSLGSGRDSASYHAHIAQVGHFSVQEHPHLTFERRARSLAELVSDAVCFLNRPGVTADLLYDPAAGAFDRLRVTLNARCVREWDKWQLSNSATVRMQSSYIGDCLRRHFKAACPAALADLDAGVEGGPDGFRPAAPEKDEEVWATFYLEGISRGASHELVRHRLCAISQRSTRYCEESESDWCPHPLFALDPGARSLFGEVEAASRKAYARAADSLHARVKGLGVEGTSARKQARGAARGLLGNALETCLVWSTSLAQLKWVIGLRAVEAADAEIRALACQLFALAAGRWPGRFAGWSRRPSSDGIGECVDAPQVK